MTPLGPDGGYPKFRDDVVAVLDERADGLRADADARRRLYLGGVLALVVAAVVIAWLVSRSITVPMRDLSVKAHSMATYRLPVAVQDILDAPPGEDLVIPEPDPSGSGPATRSPTWPEAFNDVQDSAIGLAVEQAALRRNVAESYVSLGRRNQNLLSRCSTSWASRATSTTPSTWRSSTSSTTWPPGSGATPSRSSSSATASTAATWRRRSRCPTSTRPPSARSRTTSGCSCARWRPRWCSAARPPTSPTCWPS